MIYSYPFPLKFEKVLKELTLETMKDCNTDPIYVRSLNIDDNNLNKLNEELVEYNLPPVSNFLIFKRRKMTFINRFNTHVDYTEFAGEIIKSSIVVPVEGCKNSYMYYMTGEYQLETKFLPNGNAYKVVHWTSTPHLTQKVEIVEQPMLCRVDIPHDAISDTAGNYRTILSIRLQTNPTFEEIIYNRFNIDLSIS